MDPHAASSSSSPSPPPSPRHSLSPSPGPTQSHLPSPSSSQSADTTDEQLPSSPINNARLPTASRHSSISPTGSPLQLSELERHPKGKRKRTAAKDKAILEAAYIANPKPDKSARLDIVKRVSLNEKEVQIWFQNRRQNDRRKSRPLSPQEIAALRYGGMQILSSDPMPFNSSFSTDNGNTSPAQSMSRPETGATSPPPLDHAGSSICDDQDRTQDILSYDDANPGFPLLEAVTPAQKTKPADESHQSLTRSFSGSVGYLSNRWNMSSSFSSPSALGHGGDDSFKSRDVHAWEFCCDAENREDALTVQAKHESSGSAIAAISLLRSASSSGSPLQPSGSAKRNSAMSKAVPRSGSAKRPKLGRATSSVARLQTGFGPEENKEVRKDAVYNPEKVKVSMLLSLSGNDSDKENWSPDEEGNPRLPLPQSQPIGVRRPLPSGASWLDKRSPRRTPGRRPQDRRTPPLLGSRANTAPLRGRNVRAGKRGQSPLEIFEDVEDDSGPNVPALDEEVERFMRGVASPSKKGDVDAVAGLLSLSQGNWR
ncbi:hypothetical protein B0T26DRAFT_671218 [Lasiosphaeria miniovina]|uniref:Homeobox domain-containing protein n=1 Tax=Lasiosphaeria miniovina TaxID=1954250 RepID=A0AA40BIU7_9PEZI|nr:uncharacterized protein B0T26DRAFT_671218 [Lasiosphaeria miniovina]KAK0735016.1 hypothetical protein B0T26DRAFT_671218 [Lasiosphaeria miniovina]